MHDSNVVAIVYFTERDIHTYFVAGPCTRVPQTSSGGSYATDRLCEAVHFGDPEDRDKEYKLMVALVPTAVLSRLPLNRNEFVTSLPAELVQSAVVTVTRV